MGSPSCLQPAILKCCYTVHDWVNDDDDNDDDGDDEKEDEDRKVDRHITGRNR